MTEQDGEYDEDFVATLELMWGEGFLSPGGPAEVSRIVEGLDLTGKEILDIGCGIGGCDLHLVQAHGAGHVLGVDVEPQLLEEARARAKKAGLRESLAFEQVTPGPLPYVEDCFDVVFSKDAMIHIRDKKSLFAEIFRVLKPGGHLRASDWLKGVDGEPSPEMARWIESMDLGFVMATPEEAAAAMTEAGFEAVEAIRRDDWFLQQCRDDLARMSGPAYDRLVEIRGQAAADSYVARTRLRVAVVESGELYPCHLRGRKPL